MPDMLVISPTVSIPEEEIAISFVRAAGPGGQNVNKLATAAQLRFDIGASRSIGEAVKARLRRLAGQRLSSEDIITIKAYRHRTQERNRDDARERLAALIREALTPPKPRLRTRVPMGEVRRRLEVKQRRAAVKTSRRKPAVDD